MVDLLGTALNGLVTLGAAFGGFVLAGRNQRTGDARAAERERAQHARDVATRLAEERHRDQLELLRTVQEEVHQLARTSLRIVVWDETLIREGADSTLLPPDLNTEDHDVRIRLAMHVSRVLDDSVRDDVAAMLDQMTKLTQHPLVGEGLTTVQAEAEITRRLTVIANTSNSTLDLLGAKVRAEAAWEPAGAGE